MPRKLMPCSYLIVALAVTFAATEATSEILPGTAAAEADWAERRSRPSVFYANNFSEYTDSGDLRNSANTLTHNQGAQEVLLDVARAISGGQSLRLQTHSNSGANGGAWGDQYSSGDTVNDFYFQVALYLPKETIGWRTRDGDGQLKLVNLERYGSGQVVVHHNKFLGFPTLMTNGAGVLQRYLNDIPYRSTDWFYQNAIDSGSSLAAGTQEAYWRRYGPARSTALSGGYGYVSGNTEANFLYNRASPWPNPDALASGAVPWNLDGWTVIEVYVSTSNTGPQKLKMWAAEYGNAPTLVADINAPDSDTSQTPSYAQNFYERFELLNYETPRQAETGYRPILNTYFDEVIASYEPIPFPGGFDLDSSGAQPDQGRSSSDLADVSAPGWVLDIAPGTWAAISQNKLTDVDPEKDPSANPNYPNAAPWHGSTGQEAVVKSWNGGALATRHGNRGSLILYGGGHANYYGSEVYAFDLEQRLWSRLSDPYAGPFQWPYHDGEYPDGSAIPPHTYDYAAYHPGTNSFVILKGQYELGPPSNNTSLDIPHMFDLNAKQWRRGPENASDPNLFSGGYGAYDSSRDVFWAHGGSGSNNFVAFDPNGNNANGTTGSWKTYTKQIGMTDSQGEYDPVNDILVVSAFRNDSRVAAVDLSNAENSYVWLREAGNAPAKNSAHGWSWSSERQSILYFHSGANVYEFKHTNGQWDSGTWTWRNLTESSNNSAIPESVENNNGIYSRFQVVSYADAEIAIVVNSTTGPVYAFRVPGVIRPKPPSDLIVN